MVSHDRDFLQGMSNIVYEFKDQKIREYLGDINFFLEQRNMENMREVEKKMLLKIQPQLKKEKPANCLTKIRRKEKHFRTD